MNYDCSLGFWETSFFYNIRIASITTINYSWNKNVLKNHFLSFSSMLLFCGQNLICISNSISERYCKIMHFRENFFRTSLTLWKSVRCILRKISLEQVELGGNRCIFATNRSYLLLHKVVHNKMLKNKIFKIFLFLNVVIITF